MVGVFPAAKMCRFRWWKLAGFVLRQILASSKILASIIVVKSVLAAVGSGVISTAQDAT
jgi:hypothetical protein